MTEFVMSLSMNDVSGERQESYVLVPLAARDDNPSFWDWAGGYHPLPTGQMEKNIRLNDLGADRASRVYMVPERSEFRLCTEIYRLGQAYEGCLMVVGKVSTGNYQTKVVCSADSYWNFYSAACVNGVRSGTKTWGYV